MLASRFTTRRLTVLILFVLAAGVTWSRPVQTRYTLTLSQVGSSVVINGSGTLDPSALSPEFSSAFSASIAPAAAVALVGNPSTATAYSGVSGPDEFGTGQQFDAASTTGEIAGIFVGDLVTPQNYVAGSPLSGSATFANASFDSLGFTPGTYVYTWGSGTHADSLTVIGVVPEPGAWAMIGLGAVGAGVLVMRHRRRAASRMKKLATTLLITAASLLGTGRSARADTVIFDNVNNPSNGYRSISSTSWSAQRFNTDASHLFLTGETLALDSSAPNGAFSLNLYSDASDQPGSLIATLSSGSHAAQGQVLLPGYDQALLPDTNYWLVLAEPAGLNFNAAWGVTGTNTGAGAGFQLTNATTGDGGATWSVLPIDAYRLQITASNAPEPSSVLCFVTGVVVLVILGKRRLSKGTLKAPVA